jgi:hypothetical protein
MEGADGLQLGALQDSMALIENPAEIRRRAARDGFLFFNGLLQEDEIAPLRRCILDYASRIGWLDQTDLLREARVARGKRIGDSQDPEWVGLQVYLQNRPEMRALGDAPAICRALHAVDSRSRNLCLSSANICRVFSPHADLATPPHQDANYVRLITDFWTAWIPLEHCPRDLGPIALLAGSHAGGLREHCDRGIVDSVAAAPAGALWYTTDFRCGDVVLFQSHTVHRALPNLSKVRMRMSADFRYGFWAEADSPT